MDANATDANYWRAMAEETIALAEEMTDPDVPVIALELGAALSLLLVQAVSGPVSGHTTAPVITLEADTTPILGQLNQGTPYRTRKPAPILATRPISHAASGHA